MFVRRKDLTEILLFLSVVTVCLCFEGCNDEATEHCNIGISLWKQHKNNEAIVKFNKALELNPNYERAYYYRANAYYDNGQYSRAWSDVHSAQELGFKVSPRFLKILKEVSGREK